MKPLIKLFALTILLGGCLPLVAQEVEFVEVGFGSDKKRYEIKDGDIFEVTEEEDSPSYKKIGSGYNHIEVTPKYHYLLATRSTDGYRYAYVDGEWSEHWDNFVCDHKSYTLSPGGEVFAVDPVSGAKTKIHDGAADSLRCFSGNLVRYSDGAGSLYRPDQPEKWVAASNTFKIDKKTYIVKPTTHQLDVINENGGAESTLKQNISYAYKDPIFNRVVAIGNTADHIAETQIGSSWVTTIQDLKVQGHTFTVTADRKLKIDDNSTPIENVDIIREENSNVVLHTLDGEKSIYSAPDGKWVEITQILSVDPSGKTYYIKKEDHTIWEVYRSGESKKISKITTGYLRDNDGDLISVTGQHYWKWKPKAIDAGTWEEITPTFLPAQLTMDQEGIWFFIQNKQSVMERVALGVDANGSVTLKNIPEVGSAAPFLWRFDKNGGTTMLVNKAHPGKKLAWSSNALKVADTGTEWTVALAGTATYGTNAYQLKSGANTLSANAQKALQLGAQTGDATVWLLQPDRLVSGYFLARNEETNSNQVLDRKLIGLNGSMLYGTRATSDWALMHAHLIISNYLNVLTETDKVRLYLSNPRMVVLNKDDTNNDAAGYPYINALFDREAMGKYRGRVTWDLDRGNGIDIVATVTEEMMCKTGVTNRPTDDGYREFEQVIHEFTHPLMMKMAWAGQGRPIETTGILSPSAARISSEDFCWDVQAWFNSVHSGGYETYPQGSRVQRWRTQRPSGDKMGTANMLSFMHARFNKDNTWMPPGNLRPKNYVEDNEGNRYPIVELNGQIWMAENLRATHANILCADRNDATCTCHRYGYLYRFDTRENLCAKMGPGWRLPTMDDWFSLRDKYATELFPSGSSGFNVQFSGYGNYRNVISFGQKGKYLYAGGKSDGWAHQVFFELSGNISAEEGGDENNIWCSCRCIKDN